MTVGLVALNTNPSRLRFVSANIAGPSSAGALNVTSGTTARQLSRSYFVIGSGDVSQLVSSFFAFFINAAVGITASSGYTIELCAIEINGVSVPVTFSSGRTKVIASGATDIQADALLPSAFGLSTFAWGSTGFLRLMVTFASPTTATYVNNGFTGVTGNEAHDYDPAKVIITNGVDGIGAFTYTMTGGGVDGTDIKTNSFPMVPALLGKFANFGDPATWAIIGDSAGYGTGGVGSVLGARGLSLACFPDTTLPAGALANWNLCCNSGAAPDWAAGTPSLMTQYLQYFKYAIDEYGGNNMTVPGSVAIHTQCRNAGIRYIIKTSLIPRTTDAVDFWQTEGNQTPVGAWTPGGAADIFEQGCKALVAPDLAYIDHTSIRGSTHWVFAVNGVMGSNNNASNYATFDGQHPSTNGYVFKCTGAAAVTTLSGTVTSSLRALMTSLP